MTSDDPQSRIFEAFSSSYRRHLLVALMESNPQEDSDLDPLNALATRGESPDLLRSELVHNHLPMLDEKGYIEWDRENSEVRKGSNWDEIAPLVQLIRDHRDELPDGWL